MALKPQLLTELRPIVLDTSLFRRFDSSCVDLGFQVLADAAIQSMRQHAKKHGLSFESAVHCKRLTLSYLMPENSKMRNVRLDLPTLVLFTVCAAERPGIDSSLILRPEAIPFFVHCSKDFLNMYALMEHALTLFLNSEMNQTLVALAQTAESQNANEHRQLRKLFNAEVASVRQLILKPRVF